MACARAAITDFSDSGFGAERDDESETEADAAEDLAADAGEGEDPFDLDGGAAVVDSGVDDAELKPADASADTGPAADGAASSADARAPQADARAPDANMCTDGDADGTCDFADNCPAVANAGQADADGDGTGDACDSTPAPCTAQAPSASVSAGDAELSGVRINGGANTASVAAGAKIDLALEYTFDRCGLLSRGDARFIVTGIDGERDGTCSMLSAPTCPDDAVGSVTLSINAPATPGTYYIVARGEQNRNCDNELDRSPRIAALCVR